MTKEQALNILIKHSLFFDIYMKDKYVPRAMELTLNEISSAFRVINPVWFEANKCSNCGTSMQMLIEANRVRLAEIERRSEPKPEQKSEPQFMTFPKKGRKKK